jgi:hypothetical protein
MSFKEEYAKFKQPSPEREQFVLKFIKSLPKEQIVRSMKPITITRPDGVKITYKVMPDYVMIEGMRVPMSGATAQKVADHFGLSLPTAAIAKEIYQNADVKVEAKPLSGSGVEVEGKQYSGRGVTTKGVGYAPFAVNYNDKINNQLKEKGVKGDEIVSGFAKDIIAPVKPGQLGLYGLFDSKGKPIQGGTGSTPHDTSIHTEYGSFVRLVSPDAVITYPDGRTEKKPLKDVYQISRYNEPLTPSAPVASKPSSNEKIVNYQPSKQQTGRMQLLNRIDAILSQYKDLA